MTKIEEVARAIQDAALKQRVSFRDWGGQSGIVPAINMNDIARAAIEAMKGPTEFQLRRMFDTSLGDVKRRLKAHDKKNTDFYNAMISAALAEDAK